MWRSVFYGAGFVVSGSKTGYELEMGVRRSGQTHSGVVVGKSIVDFHILKEPSDMVVEKSLNLLEVELGIDEDCPNVSFNYIGKALKCPVSSCRRKTSNENHLGRVLCSHPIVA